MLFCSTHYLVFLLGVFVVYWLLPWARARVALLLAASLFFYASWSTRLTLLVVATSLLDFLLARGIEATSSPRRRRLLLGVSLTANLGVLVYFKYANFFLASLEQALHAVGAAASLPVLRVLAPIGISFYTFEAISYVVDVYQRKIPAERNPFHFLLFITFFPHLVSGPIVRGRDFLPQVRRPRRWNWARLHLGVQLLVLGLFKKLAIADRMALYAEPVFAHSHLYCSSALWTGLLAFAVQVYCDFSGYSDMALGSAHLLGYKLTVNFRLPFLAVNVADLWRRWHISLSNWMRDYLFIPLGGSRGSFLRTSINLIVVMTLGGLWHGAGWGFVLWGFLHGCFLAVHRAFQVWCRRHPGVRRQLETSAGTALRIALTFACFVFPLIFFRSPSLDAALTMLRGLTSPHDGIGAPMTRHSLAGLLLLLAAGHFLAARRVWARAEARLPAPALGVGYAAVALAALVLAPQVSQAFLYFQF
jgi:alginate O-acetyltransferase complex protein AlgI